MTENETETGNETEITIETGTGRGSGTVIESRKNLLAALSDGGDALCLHHPYPTRGAADAQMKGRHYEMCNSVLFCKAQHFFTNHVPVEIL